MSKQSGGAATNPAPEEQRPPLSDRRRNALLRYMAILFGVAFLLVLLSFLIQIRDSRETISDLHQSNASALQNAVQLQEESQALAEANGQLQEQLETYQTDLDEAREESEALRREVTNLETQLTDARRAAENTAAAYDLLLQARQAADDGDQETLASLLSQLEPLAEHLSDSARAEYGILQGQLTAETGLQTAE